MYKFIHLIQRGIMEKEQYFEDYVLNESRQTMAAHNH